MNMSDEILFRLENIERMTMLAAKNVLSLEDASFITGISKSSLYKMTSKHEIPHYKPNGKFLYFDRKELEDWMKQNRVQTKAEAEQQAINYVVTKEKGGRYGNA